MNSSEVLVPEVVPDRNESVLGPFSEREHIRTLIEVTGLDLADLKRARQKLVEQLDAHDTEVVGHGEKAVVIQKPNHVIQNRAANDLLKLAQLSITPKGSTAAPEITAVQVNINGKVVKTAAKKTRRHG